MRDTVGVELLERVQFFARGDVLDRYARYLAQRECGATARIAVHFGEDDTRQRHVFEKALGHADGLLASHGIGHEQDFVRRDLRLHRLELAHELLVDLQTTRGVENHVAEAGLLGVFDRRLGELGRLLIRIVEDGHVDLFPERLQLRNSRRSVGVGGDQQRLVTRLAKLEGQLGRGRRFSRALQPDQHDNGRWLRRNRQPRR